MLFKLCRSTETSVMAIDDRTQAYWVQYWAQKSLSNMFGTLEVPKEHTTPPPKTSCTLYLIMPEPQNGSDFIRTEQTNGRKFLPGGLRLAATMETLRYTEVPPMSLLVTALLHQVRIINFASLHAIPGTHLSPRGSSAAAAQQAHVPQPIVWTT